MNDCSDGISIWASQYDCSHSSNFPFSFLWTFGRLIISWNFFLLTLAIKIIICFSFEKDMCKMMNKLSGLDTLIWMKNKIYCQKRFGPLVRRRRNISKQKVWEKNPKTNKKKKNESLLWWNNKCWWLKLFYYPLVHMWIT